MGISLKENLYPIIKALSDLVTRHALQTNSHKIRRSLTLKMNHADLKQGQTSGRLNLKEKMSLQFRDGVKLQIYPPVLQ